MSGIIFSLIDQKWSGHTLLAARCHLLILSNKWWYWSTLGCSTWLRSSISVTHTNCRCWISFLSFKLWKKTFFCLSIHLYVLNLLVSAPRAGFRDCFPSFRAENSRLEEILVLSYLGTKPTFYTSSVTVDHPWLLMLHTSWQHLTHNNVKVNGSTFASM